MLRGSVAWDFGAVGLLLAKFEKFWVGFKWFQMVKGSYNKLVELEDRSGRNNIGIDGIKEHNKESWEECERTVHSMLKECRECGDRT